MGQADDARLLRRGVRLEYLTLAWNVVGVGVLALSAWRARSLALAGFGLDSLIEILASAVVVWQLTGAGKGRERTALRVISVSFALLCCYILAQAALGLIAGARPAASPVGLAWLALTVVAMLTLAAAKRSTGRRLGQQVLISEAGVTLVDAGLAAAVLVGVALNALLHWWWADPLSSLAIVGYGARESREAWRHAKAIPAG
jgi:divalent metal cation (Fe/Co/Zn/Cd) transporter